MIHGSYHFSDGDLPSLTEGQQVTVKLSGSRLQVNAAGRSRTVSSIRLIRDSGGLSLPRSQHP